MAKVTGIKYNRSELSDIMATALYGAIGYWCSIYEEDYDTEGSIKSFTIAPPHEEGEWGMFEGAKDTAMFRVLLNDIQRGVDRILSGEAEIHEEIRSQVASGDPGDIDAEGADCIVQAAVFGKVVYG